MITHTLISLEYLRIKEENGKGISMDDILTAGKPLSLTEKNIEDKALIKYPVIADYLGMSGDGTKNFGKDFNFLRRESYIQALKDLL